MPSLNSTPLQASMSLLEVPVRTLPQPSLSSDDTWTSAVAAYTAGPDTPAVLDWNRLNQTSVEEASAVNTAPPLISAAFSSKTASNNSKSAPYEATAPPTELAVLARKSVRSITARLSGSNRRAPPPTEPLLRLSTKADTAMYNSPLDSTTMEVLVAPCKVRPTM